MRLIEKSSEFKRNLKLAKKRGKDLGKLVAVVELLQADSELPDVLKDHALIGRFVGFRDCHIEPDWVLIYKKLETPEPTLLLYVMGSHSDLF